MRPKVGIEFFCPHWTHFRVLFDELLVTSIIHGSTGTRKSEMCWKMAWAEGQRHVCVAVLWSIFTSGSMSMPIPASQKFIHQDSQWPVVGGNVMAFIQDDLWGYVLWSPTKSPRFLSKSYFLCKAKINLTKKEKQVISRPLHEAERQYWAAVHWWDNKNWGTFLWSWALEGVLSTSNDIALPQVQ